MRNHKSRWRARKTWRSVLARDRQRKKRNAVALGSYEVAVLGPHNPRLNYYKRLASM